MEPRLYAFESQHEMEVMPRGHNLSVIEQTISQAMAIATQHPSASMNLAGM